MATKSRTEHKYARKVPISLYGGQLICAEMRRGPQGIVR